MLDIGELEAQWCKSPMSVGLEKLADALYVERQFTEIGFYDFIQAAWPIVEPGRAFVPNWHIDAIVDHLEAVTRGEIFNLLINMPPRNSKSLLTSVFWQPWVWTRQPETRWICNSYDITLSTRDCVSARRVIESPWYQENWGKVFQLSADQNQKQRFDNTRTGIRMATSNTSKATGFGGDYLLNDDPLKAGDENSEAKLEESAKHWTVTMRTRVNDPNNLKQVVVMQRLAEKDLSGVLLEMGDYVHLCLPMEYEPKLFSFLPPGAPNPLNFKDPRTEVGELLNKPRFSKEAVASLKHSLRDQYNGQYQQNPTPPEGNLFKEKWHRYYKKHPVVLPDYSISIGGIKCKEQFLSVDCRFGDSKTSGSYVAIGAWCVGGPNLYLFDAIRERLDFNDTCAAILSLLKKYPGIGAKLIENKANGPAVINSMSVATNEREAIRGLIPIEPKEYGGDKLARANASLTYFEAGNVWYPHENLFGWMVPLLKEVRSYPKSVNNDFVDMITQAVNWRMNKSSVLDNYRTMLGLLRV